MKGFFFYFYAFSITFSTAVLAREWTSVDGRKIEAEIVSATGDSVKILRGEKEFTLPLEKLVEADRAFVKTWLEEEKEKKFLLGIEKEALRLGGTTRFSLDVPEDLKVASAGWVPEINPAKIGLAVPADFNPDGPNRVLAINTTSGAKGASSIGHMRGFVNTALNEGWVVIAAEGSVLPGYQTDTNEYRWAVLGAGLRHLHEKWPASKDWDFACAGNSGGAKRSGYIAAIMAKEGYNVIGMYMGGCNDDMASRGLDEYRPKKSVFQKVPIFLSSGEKDGIATPAQTQGVAARMERNGFKNVRVESHPGGHGLSNEHITMALKWFVEMEVEED